MREQIKDPMLHAAAEALREHPDHMRWLSYADAEMQRLRDLAGLPTPTGYAQGEPVYPPHERVTHGRHCTCSACARENWANAELSCCGMHGPSCPQVYAPLGPAGSLVPVAAQEPGS